MEEIPHPTRAITILSDKNSSYKDLQCKECFWCLDDSEISNAVGRAIQALRSSSTTIQRYGYALYDWIGIVQERLEPKYGVR